MITDYRAYWEKLKDKCIDLLSSDEEEKRKKGRFLKKTIDSIINKNEEREVQWCEDI